MGKNRLPKRDLRRVRKWGRDQAQKRLKAWLMDQLEMR